MSKRQELYLWHLATKLEREARGACVRAPAKGQRGTYDVFITKAEWANNKLGEHVYQVTFLSHQGWRGRWETTNEKHVQAVSDRLSDEMQITATVKWSREDFGILGGRASVSFRVPGVTIDGQSGSHRRVGIHTYKETPTPIGETPAPLEALVTFAERGLEIHRDTPLDALREKWGGTSFPYWRRGGHLPLGDTACPRLESPMRDPSARILPLRS
jgi:hypothetical protein